MDLEKLKEAGVDVLKDLLKKWHLDLIFFVAVFCEVVGSQFILSLENQFTFNPVNIFILSGFSVFWYSVCITCSISLNVYLTIMFGLRKIPINIGQTLLPIALLLSGISLFSASALILVASFFGLRSHIHFYAVALAFVILTLLVRIMFKRITRSFAESGGSSGTSQN